MAVKRHMLDIYGTEIALATTKREWATLRRRLNFLDRAPESAGQANFATFHPNDGGIARSHLVFWIDRAAHKDDDLELIDTCAHEAAHGVGRLFEWIGHEVKGTDEPSAYLTGWLTRWIFEGVRGE